MKFISFLIEKRQAETQLKSIEDAKGKLFEVLSGSYLFHGENKKTGMPNAFLEHFRDEDGFRPEDIHNKAKEALDRLSPGMYQQVVEHSKSAAEHLREELKKRGIHNISHLGWTSQPGDHGRFTKMTMGQSIEDPNTDADLMAYGTNEKGEAQDPVPLSMKYGSTKDPNLRGNGTEALEKLAGLKPGTLDNLRDKHYKFIQSQGLQTGKAGDAAYKALAKKGDKRAAAIDDHALATQQAMSKRISQGLAGLSSDQLKESIRKLISPQTKFQTLRHHTVVNKDGSASHETHNVQELANDSLDTYEEYRVRPHTGGITSVIEARRAGSKEFEPALSIGVKKGRTYSGRGFNSFTKAPMLRANRKTRASRSAETNKTATKKVKGFKEVSPQLTRSAKVAAKKNVSDLRTSPPNNPRVRPLKTDANGRAPIASAQNVQPPPGTLQKRLALRLTNHSKTMAKT
jgi:hypothetical protein